MKIADTVLIMNRPLAVKESESKCTCMNCLAKLQKRPKVSFRIDGMGYGSKFDGITTTLILCVDCYNKFDSSIFSYSRELSDYKDLQLTDEDALVDIIERLPIEGRELFENRLSERGLFPEMDPQSWIDFILEDLSYEDAIKCKTAK